MSKGQNFFDLYGIKELSRDIRNYDFSIAIIFNSLRNLKTLQHKVNKKEIKKKNFIKMGQNPKPQIATSIDACQGWKKKIKPNY